MPFDCKSTAELSPLEEIVGQERAVKALQFGLHIDGKGFNVFISGLPGTGRKTAILDLMPANPRSLPVVNCFASLDTRLRSPSSQ